MQSFFACVLFLLATIPLSAQPRPAAQRAPVRIDTVVRIVHDTVIKVVHDTVTVEKADSKADRQLVYLALVALLVSITQAGFFLWQLKQIAKQLGQTETQLNQSRDDFIATHRPRVEVRNVLFRNHSYATGDEENSRSVGYRIEYTVVNTGSSVARITHSSTVHDLTPDPEAWGQIGESNYFSNIPRTDFPIEPGESAVFHVKSSSFLTYGQNISGRYFTGFIRYADQNGVERSTAFLRRTEPVPETGRFRLIREANPDFEYAD